ncbi:MAG: ATP-binding cassette domain-containing protein [Luteolibacter sp.]
MAKPSRRAILRRAIGLLPGVGRMRTMRPGSDAHIGMLVDAFTTFAMLDGKLSSREADLILDLLHSSYPEVDHSWMRKRVRRAASHPKSLTRLALNLKNSYREEEKLSLGLQLFILVDAASRSEPSHASFKVFMEQLGHPDFGSAIIREMQGVRDDDDTTLPFERLIFGHAQGKTEPDVELPPKAIDHEFRVYRSKDLILVRNTGGKPLWNRGRLVESGAFLRMRARQPLILPGCTLTHEDLAFFLDAKRTGIHPTIYLERKSGGFVAEKSHSRFSVLRVRFGLQVSLKVLQETSLCIAQESPLKPNQHLRCSHHQILSDEDGFRLSFHELRRLTMHSGRRFKLSNERHKYRVSNDTSELERGDLLLGQGLSPSCLLEIDYDASEHVGELEIISQDGPIKVDKLTVRHRATLRDGSLIRLSDQQAVRCRFSEGFLDEECTLIKSLKAENLTHDFSHGIRALHHVDFEVQRGEMLCIIGPSGCGKSTLLAALSGQKKTSRGRVLLNGLSLYDNRNSLVPFIAYMPQEEALNPQLTVREHLRHASTMRRPAQSLAEHECRVDGIIAELGLQSLAHRRVGQPGEKSLSGGERSRLNLGLDLASRAEVFLFDEPISGLSSKDSEHVADSLRALAQEKIVIASLHRPGAQVLGQFDKVLLLDDAGRVAFFGAPTAMVEYFRLACKELEINHPAIQIDAPLGADFVFDVLETPLSGGGQDGSVRRFPSTFWQERFEGQALMQSIGIKTPPITRAAIPVKKLPILRTTGRRMRATAAVFATHFVRSFTTKFRNRGTIYSTCLEAPLLAALISITLRSSPQGQYEFQSALHIPAYLFLSSTVAMFLGLTNSATEILRDRPLLRRERNCQPAATLYITAKFMALSFLATLQCFIYSIIGNHFLEIEGMLLSQWGWMSLTAWTGTSLALLVSAVVKSERAALTAVPLLLVPQMLLAGALVPYKEMNRGLFEDASLIREKSGIPVPAKIMPLRYAYEGMVVTQAVRNPFEVERIRLQRRLDRMRNSGNSLTPSEADRFETIKSGLRRLLASGASDLDESRKLVKRIRQLAIDGTAIELESIDVWPEQDGQARSTSDFFVNQRIDLMIREAETFRNDYRNRNYREVFLALRKPMPWMVGKPIVHEVDDYDPPYTIETLKYCAFVLLLVITGCLGLTTLTVSLQNRQTK